MSSPSELAAKLRSCVGDGTFELVYQPITSGLLIECADALESIEKVVRCKDCKHYLPEGFCEVRFYIAEDHRDLDWQYQRNEYWNVEVLPNDFCSYGNRMTGEDDDV